MSGAERQFSLSRLKRRFIVIFAFLFLIHNPTGLSAVDWLRNSDNALWYRLTLAVVILTLLIVLLRHTWTAMRMLGSAVVVLLILSIAALLWHLWDWVEISEMTRYLASILVITSILTFGQIVPLAVRQLSGQKGVLKYPP